VIRRLSRAQHVGLSGIAVPDSSYDESLAGLEWVASVFEKERRIPVLRHAQSSSSSSSSSSTGEFVALVCGPWSLDMAQVAAQCELLRQVVPLKSTVHFDYAGFGLARTVPLSERRCVDDAVSVYRWLLESVGVAPNRLLVIGVEVGACVALELAYLGTKPPSEQRKLLGVALPSPLCAALVLQAPAIAPPLGLAAALLRPSGGNEAFAAQRKHYAFVSVPSLVVVGKKARALVPSDPAVVVDPPHVVAAAKQLKFLWRLLEIDDTDSDLFEDDDYLGAVRSLVGVMLGSMEASDRALETAFVNRPTQFQSPEEVIRAWLKELGLQEHATLFVANGYDSLPIIRTMTAEELAGIGIVDETQQALILSSLAVDDGDSHSSTNLPRVGSASQVSSRSVSPGTSPSDARTGGQRERAAALLSSAPIELGAAASAASLGSSAYDSSVLSAHDGVAIGAPLWLETPACAVCQTPFSMLRRKHHCRACGASVCFNCAKGTLRLISADVLAAASIVSPRQRYSLSLDADQFDDVASSSAGDVTPLTSPRGTPIGASISSSNSKKMMVRTRKRRTTSIMPAQSAPTSPQGSFRELSAGGGAGGGGGSGGGGGGSGSDTRSSRNRGNTLLAGHSALSLSYKALALGEKRCRACDRCASARAQIQSLTPAQQSTLRALSLAWSVGKGLTLKAGLSALFVEERARFPCTVTSYAGGAVFLVEIADITRSDTRRIVIYADQICGLKRGAQLFPSASVPDDAKAAMCFSIVCDSTTYHFQPSAPVDAWIDAFDVIVRHLQHTQEPPAPPVEEPDDEEEDDEEEEDEADSSFESGSDEDDEPRTKK
jgi:hypothetical protein